MGFMPCFTKRQIRERGRLETLSNEQILAEAISDLINEEGPQFVPELDNAIFEEYKEQVAFTTNFSAIMRRRNSYYEKLGIRGRQLCKILKELYPAERVTSCRGVHSQSNVLFKTDDSLKIFFDGNFRPPRQGYPYWQYLPEDI